MIDLASIRNLQPIRRGADIFVVIDGREVKLSPMQANLILQAWATEVGAALVTRAHSSGSEQKQLNGTATASFPP